MTSTARTRRAVGVSTGALALCISSGLLSGGVAFADTGLPPVPPVPSVPSVPSVPGVPSPDNVVTTLDQTVKQVTSTNPTTPPTSGGPTQSKPPATTKQPSAPKTVTKRVLTHPAARPAAPSSAQQSAAMQNWSPPSSFDAVMPTDIALPPAMGVSAAAGTAPAVAPLLMPQSTQYVTPSAAMTDLDKHSGSPMRAILLTLAVAAAAGVSYGHLRVVRI